MGFISVAIYRRKGNKNMTTIIKDEKDVLKLKIGTIIKPEDDRRPNNKKHPEYDKHIQELEDAREKETGQL